ncbi:MAG: hypothetical protein KAX49_09520 [Halanaerobiales bacterium]|nr:hypothetical protein [Halanaerobiales bacterium]
MNSVESRGSNLIPNPSFEDIKIDSTGIPSGWLNNIYSTDSSNISIVADSAGASGSKAVKLDNTNFSTSNSLNIESVDIAVVGGKTYRQAGWIKGNGQARLYLGRAWFNSSGNRISYNYAAAGVNPTEWTYYEKTVVAPQDAVKCRIWLINYSNTTGIGYFDNLIFTEDTGAGEVVSSSNVVIDSQRGYMLARDRFASNDSFIDKDTLNTSYTTASINEALGEITLPENQSTARWVDIVSEEPAFQLQKNVLVGVSTFLKSISPNTPYSGYKYTYSDGWQPPVASGNWQLGPSFTMNKDQTKDITKLQLEIKSSLINSWVLFGGWGNWTMWAKVVINQTYVGMVSFRTNVMEYDLQTKYLPVDLVDKGLDDPNDGWTIQVFWVVNKWGSGTTKGGNIKSIKATATEKLGYPVNQTESKSYFLSLEKNKTYKFEADDDSSTSSYKIVTYKLIKGNTVQELSNNKIFTVPADGNYELRINISSTNSSYTPTVNKVIIFEEKKYSSSAVARLNTLTLPENCKSIALDYEENLMPGTRIEYRVSNDGGTNWKTPVYDSVIKKYVANFTNAGNKVILKATLYSDTEQRYTPTLSNVKITAWDSGKYSSSGKVITKTIHISDPSTGLVLELHGKKNLGSINVSLKVNGEIIAGVLTGIEDLVEVPEGVSYPASLYLLSAAMALRSEINDADMQYYYYKFDLPENITTSFDAELTIQLNASADRKSTPTVYSYVLLNSELKYFTSGSFSTSNYLSPQGDYTFDEIRLDVVGEVPTNTAVSYEVFDFGNGQSVSLTSGVKSSLGIDTDYLKLRGTLTITDEHQTPKISRMTLTAVGETPLVNDLESLDDVDYIKNSYDTLSVSTDRVVGDTSLMIDHTDVGYNYYSLNRYHVYDAIKLPIIQIWVKPMTEISEIAFAVIDQTDGKSKRFVHDADRDTRFEVGEDLIFNQWNLILLDLRDVVGGEIVKDAMRLNVIVDNAGTKVLIDGVSSLPLNQVNYVYDKAGNRTGYTENGLATTYEYEFGSNRLKRRYNQHEDIYYTYDYNGNLIRQEVTSYGDYYYFDYVYNELNQLVEIKKNGSLIAEYCYDHGGLRYKKVDNVTNKTTIYVYGTGYEPIYEEIYSNSNLGIPLNKISYLSMGGKRIARAEDNSKSYYFADHLGSTRIVMDESGNCTYSEYKPFGSDFVSSNERYKFTGKEDDGVTGLQYFNARYYDPGVGRFISEDFVKQGYNWYLYSGNNPVVNADKNGLWFDTFFDIAGIVMDIVDIVKHPKNAINWVALGADVGCMVLPGATGGRAVKAIGKADDMMDIVKGAKKIDDVIDVAKGMSKLSSKNIKHMSKHISSEFFNQAKYLSKEALEGKLKKNTFFNPNRSKEQIISIVESGYHVLKNQGLTGLQSYVVKGETIKIFIKADGTFDTAYGLHKLTSEFFGH